MKTKLIKSIILTVAGIASLASVSCNTVNGAGRDFQKMGNSMQKTAQGGFWKGSSPASAPAPQMTPNYPPADYAVPR